MMWCGKPVYVLQNGILGGYEMNYVEKCFLHVMGCSMLFDLSYRKESGFLAAFQSSQLLKQ